MPPSPSRILRHAGVPAFLVSNLTNIRYLTKMACSDGLALVTPRSIFLLLDGRYTEAARHEAYPSIHIRDRRELGKLLKKIPTIGIESGNVTLQEKAQLKRIYKNTKFVHTSGIIEHFRRSKESVELRSLRKADHMTREMLRRVPAALVPGMRESDLAWLLRSWARELGAEEFSFDPIVAFGSHTSRPHHHTGPCRLKKRDIILVDCGARYRGYCGDRTEMFFVGKPTVEQERALRAVQEAKDTAIAQVRAGASTKEIDGSARDVLQSYGMEDAFVHALGHGVGLDIHEGVSLSKHGREETLLHHEVITIEPGVYFPNKFGIRLEDMIVVP